MGFSYLGTTMTWHSCPCGKTPPKPPLQLVINLNSLSQLIQTGFGFLFQLFFPLISILKIIWSLRDFQSKYTFSFEFWPQTNSPGLSSEPTTQNHLDPLLLFSNFSKFSLCKFGPDLPNLVKFISTLLQKFHQNSGSLFEQGEATPPKISSRKNHQRPISFGRTPVGHCYWS